jgi:hypothetical protein
VPLTSELGIRQILLMGSVLPTPAPYEVLQALTSVEVTNDKEAGDGFQLVIQLHKDRSLDYGLLKNPVFAPGTRVIIGVILGITPEVLIDGVITHHQVKVSGGAGGELTVTGKDITSVMDLEEHNGGFDNQPDSVIALRVIAGTAYASLGLVPAVTPTTDVPIQVDRVPSQQETDLAFLRRTAERNGFVFYVEPLTFGVNKAYWGPENRLGLPQPALTQDMGAATNLKSLDFSHDSLTPVAPSGVFVEPFFKLSIPIPALPSLRIPPLASTPAPALRRTIQRDTANQNPLQAATSVIAAATNSGNAVSGDGELETVKYGHVLRARRLVGVRGAGLSYDGLYSVDSVTHKLMRGEYGQRFRISREGTGTTVPAVLP